MDDAPREDQPPPPGNSPTATLFAVVAGLVGVAALVLAGIRIVDLVGGGSNRDAAEAVTTATAEVATTSSQPDPPLETTTSMAAVFDPSGLVTVSDDSEQLAARVPADWTDVRGSPWVVDGNSVGLALTAASDVDAWHAEWGTPGTFIGVTNNDYIPNPGDFSGPCSRGDLEQLITAEVTGSVQAWHDCGDAGSDFFVFLGNPTAGSGTVLIQLVATDPTGSALLEQIVSTLSIP